MRNGRHRWRVVLPVVAALVLGACGGDDSGGDSADGDGASGPFELATSPEFVNMVIPGRRPLALVTATGDSADPVTLAVTTTFEGATVEAIPSEIEPGGVAELWVVLPEVTAEAPLEVTVSGTRGEEEHTATIEATAMPGTDDLEPTALDIAAVFLDELAGTVDLLPATVDGLEQGTPVGGLLVVTHYAWFTETVEIGLAWHVMVAPDDWSELTIRPRDELAPTRAFRLSSWSTALAGGEVDVVEIEPPPEVMR